MRSGLGGERVGAAGSIDLVAKPRDRRNGRRTGKALQRFLALRLQRGAVDLVAELA